MASPGRMPVSQFLSAGDSFGGFALDAAYTCSSLYLGVDSPFSRLSSFTNQAFLLGFCGLL